MDRKRICSILVAAASFAIACLLILQTVEYSMLYDLPQEEIVSAHPEQHHSLGYRTSVTDGKELEAKMLLLCGNSILCDLTAEADATVTLTDARRFGAGKLLLQNRTSGAVSAVALSGEETEIVLDAGQYCVFLTGKWFCGTVRMETDALLSVS